MPRGRGPSISRPNPPPAPLDLSLAKSDNDVTMSNPFSTPSENDEHHDQLNTAGEAITTDAPGPASSDLLDALTVNHSQNASTASSGGYLHSGSPQASHFPIIGTTSSKSSEKSSRPNTSGSNIDIPSGGPPTRVNSSTGLSLRSGVRESFAAPPPMPSMSRFSSASHLRPNSLRPGTAGTTGSLSGARSSSPLSKQTRSLAPARAKSTALPEDYVIEKPWLEKKDPYVRWSWWLTVSLMFVGVALSALLCFFGYKQVPNVGNLCLIMEDDFNGPELDTNIWMREAEMGGFGNGEFEMTTTSTNNSFIDNGILYLAPTLTSDAIGVQNMYNGFTFNLTGCTSTNITACSGISNATTNTIINPIQSARLSTRKSKSIQYGKVEIRAKLPKGDWLWPALWMLPVDNSYGPWPMSGEIDIMESRGNGPEYPKQGSNYVRGSLNWGPLTWINEVSKTFSWWFEKRSTFNSGFHTYTLEWNEDFMRIYVDTRLHKMFDIKFNIPFFQRGNFPPSVFNGTNQIALTNPWAGRPNSAPFDRPFYLIMNVAVGGTNGWFPDGAGNKPWLDGSFSAMHDFALANQTWLPTWPTDLKQRGMAIDYVKMWQKC